MTRPLDGINVVEAVSTECPLSLRLASAMAGRIAADLGATVVKLEPVAGDPVRDVPPLVGEVSTLYAFLNAGKTLNVADAPPHDIVDAADALILDDALWHARSSAGAESPTASGTPVAAVLSLFGATRSGVSPASEFTIMALTGILDIVGDPAREPLKLGGHQLAYAAGLCAYTGLAAGLVAAHKRGDGSAARDVVRVSLFDTALWLNWKNVTSAAMPGGRVATRTGRTAQWQVLRCADGWIAVVFLDSDWPALRELVGDARLGEARFATDAARSLHADELGRIIESSFLRYTRRELEDLARPRRLPLGAVWNPEELATDRQYLSRQFLRSIGCPATEGVIVPRLPALWTGSAMDPGTVPAKPRLPASAAA